jgi:mRNA interferase MazF
MKVRRGEVVLVDFPYSDHTGSKVRPALVVQADAWNQRLDDTMLALITSSRHRRVGAATQLVIDITTAEGQQTGLRLNSVIQCENRLLSRDCQSSEQFAGLNRRYDEMQAEFALVPLTISETSQEEEL